MLKTEIRERFIEAIVPADSEYMIANLTEQERNTLFNFFDEAHCYINALVSDGCTDESEYKCIYQQLCGILMWLDSIGKLHYSHVAALGKLAVDMCLPDEIFGKSKRS